MIVLTSEIHLLTPREYRLLERFLRNSHLVAQVKRLRQKLKTAVAPHSLIETVNGLSYRLKQLQHDS